MATFVPALCLIATLMAMNLHGLENRHAWEGIDAAREVRQGTRLLNRHQRFYM